MRRPGQTVVNLLAAGLVAGLAFGLTLGVMPRLAGPAGAASDPSGTPAASATATPKPVHYQGHFTLTPDRGIAGTVVQASGTGFQPGSTLSIHWNTVSGHWVLKGTANESFDGRAFDPVERPITDVSVDATGAFSGTFVIPDDYGFSHDVTVLSGDTVVNKAAFRIDPQVALSARSGPVGTPIQLTMDGIGWASLENSWMVTYDNQFTGWLSAVTTDGLAVTTIPAAGQPGVHIIRVIHGAFTVPYLNGDQSPEPDRPTFQISFTVTAGDPILPASATTQALPTIAGTAPTGSGPRIWTDPQRATVGTPFTVFGAGFPAGAPVSLTWATVVGNRVGGQGWDEQTSPLGSATAGSDGSFSLALAVPDDLGGVHHIDALVGGSSKATANLTISPSAFPVEMMQGPAGSTITLHLKGVGWTETANIYTLVYDNGYLGYVCGFNSGGDVLVRLPASGSPGWHFIDLYPAVYKGSDMSGVSDFRIPQLTFAADHPGEQLPAFHFAFDVTP